MFPDIHMRPLGEEPTVPPAPNGSGFFLMTDSPLSEATLVKTLFSRGLVKSQGYFSTAYGFRSLVVARWPSPTLGFGN